MPDGDADLAEGTTKSPSPSRAMKVKTSPRIKTPAWHRNGKKLPAPCLFTTPPLRPGSVGSPATAGMDWSPVAAAVPPPQPAQPAPPPQPERSEAPPRAPSPALRHDAPAGASGEQQQQPAAPRSAAADAHPAPPAPATSGTPATAPSAPASGPAGAAGDRPATASAPAALFSVGTASLTSPTRRGGVSRRGASRAPRVGVTAPKAAASQPAASRPRPAPTPPLFTQPAPAAAPAPQPSAADAYGFFPPQQQQQQSMFSAPVWPTATDGARPSTTFSSAGVATKRVSDAGPAAASAPGPAVEIASSTFDASFGGAASQAGASTAAGTRGGSVWDGAAGAQPNGTSSERSSAAQAEGYTQRCAVGDTVFHSAHTAPVVAIQGSTCSGDHRGKAAIHLPPPCRCRVPSTCAAGHGTRE